MLFVDKYRKKDNTSQKKCQFRLERNIHMYNHVIHCDFGGKHYEAICESAPTKEEKIIFWLDDFGMTEDEEALVIEELEKFGLSEGFKCIFNKGKRC